MTDLSHFLLTKPISFSSQGYLFLCIFTSFSARRLASFRIFIFFILFVLFPFFLFNSFLNQYIYVVFPYALISSTDSFISPFVFNFYDYLLLGLLALFSSFFSSNCLNWIYANCIQFLHAFAVFPISIIHLFYSLCALHSLLFARHIALIFPSATLLIVFRICLNKGPFVQFHSIFTSLKVIFSFNMSQ